MAVYATSRGFVLPSSPEEMADALWFNMWRTRLWPYGELLPHDTLYWYESPRKHLRWRSVVSEVERFPYVSKADAAGRLGLTREAAGQPYFRDAPEAGYCVAWRVMSATSVDLPKPDGSAFPQVGWLRLTGEPAQAWLGGALPEDTTLDDLAGEAAALDCLLSLSQQLEDVSPERIEALVSLTIRRDSRLVQALKQACSHRCQFPGCSATVRKRDGSLYVEVAHVRPIARGGKSVLGNLLVLCPNHHKELDYGELSVERQTPERVAGRLNGTPFDIRLPGEAEPSPRQEPPND